MENKRNKVVIIILMFFIAGLIIANFILAEPKYMITVEVIICLCLLVILSLSEMFDNLSIPKVISLSRNVKEVKRENDNLKNTNIKLLEQIMSIKNSNNQSLSFSINSSSNIDDINKNDDKVESENSDILNEQQNNSKHISEKHSIMERAKYRRHLEVYMLEKLLNNIPNSIIRYDVKLTNNKMLDDNIMKNEAHFDAMSSNFNENVFYEVKVNPSIMDFSYQLHYMLRTIQLYMETTNNNCKLVLVLPKYSEELMEMYTFGGYENRFLRFKEQIRNLFEPAINNHLLELVEVDVSKEELVKYVKEKEKNNDSNSKK